MRSETALVWGLAIGLAGGWVAHEGFAPKIAAATRQGDEERAHPGVGAPELAGRRSDDPPTTLSRGVERVLRQVGDGRSKVANTRALVALATLLAAGGDEAEFLRLAGRALAQGVRLDELLPALEELPAGRRAAVLAALLDAHPTAVFETVPVARLLAEGGLSDRALALVTADLPRRGDLEPELARLLLELDPEGGARRLFDLEASTQWDEQALGVLRALFIGAGQDRALLPFLERALDERPADHDALRWLRRLDPVAARSRLTTLLRSHPEDARAWSLLGDLERDSGDSAAAFEAYRRFAEREPGRSAFRELVKADPARGLELVVGWTKDTADDEMLGALGEMYLLAGRKEEAVRALLRAHEHDPADSEWLRRLTEVDPAAAVSVLERRIGSVAGGADEDTLGRYAEALAAAGRRQEAFQQYLEAHRKDPDEGEWQEALVRLDPQGALPVFEAHVRAHPGDAAGHGSYGLALAVAGRRGEAAEHVERALAGGDARRWYRALRDLDPDRALDALWRRAWSDARDDDLWGLVGRELRGARRDAEARAAYEAAARLDPSNREWAEALRDLR